MGWRRLDCSRSPSCWTVELLIVFRTRGRTPGTVLLLLDNSRPVNTKESTFICVEMHVYGRLKILEFAWNRLCPILLPPFPPMCMGQYLWWGCTSTTISSSGLWPKAILYYDYYIINLSENRLHTIESSGFKKRIFPHFIGANHEHVVPQLVVGHPNSCGNKFHL